jgi:putative intracellular protease/amidase
MATILMPIPDRDFDPTEVAVTWSVLTRLGHVVVFATPDGQLAEADTLMLSGQGLDFWGFLPGLRRLVLVGRLLRANREARHAYAALRQDAGFRSPASWAAARLLDCDGLVLCGGHRARGMRPYLESPILHAIVADAFDADRPVGAICHGVLLVARSRDANGRSVLYGRRTTALTWKLERTASRIGRIVRFWDPTYYRTYPDGPEAGSGFMSVQQEVTRALAQAEDFQDVPAGTPESRAKASGLLRDRWDDPGPAFVVRDGNYVSARWPGDTYSFARTIANVLSELA